MPTIAEATEFYLKNRFNTGLPTEKKVAALKQYLAKHDGQLNCEAKRRLASEIERYKNGTLK